MLFLKALTRGLRAPLNPVHGDLKLTGDETPYRPRG